MKIKAISIFIATAVLLGGWWAHNLRKNPSPTSTSPQVNSALPTKLVLENPQAIVQSTSDQETPDISVLYSPGTLESKTLQDTSIRLNVYSQSFGEYSLAPHELLVDLDKAIAESLSQTQESQALTIISHEGTQKQLPVLKILHSSRNDKYYGVIPNEENESSILSESFLTPHTA